MKKLAQRVNTHKKMEEKARQMQEEEEEAEVELDKNGQPKERPAPAVITPLLNEQQLEQIKLRTHDFWAGHLMASFPYMFMDLELKQVQIKGWNI